MSEAKELLEQALSDIQKILGALGAKRRDKPNYSLYKPLAKADAGAALQFKYAEDIDCLFVEAAKQKGARLPTGDKNQFDWENKITFKLGLTDIGQILLVLTGRQKTLGKEGRGLIHRSERDGVTRTSSMQLKKQSKDAEGRGYDNYALKLGKVEEKNGKRENPISIGIYVDHHEMAIIGTLLRRAAEKMLGLS